MSSRGKIAVGMSGGLDSSVVASLLQEQGHEVIGLTAHMWKEGSRCCSLEDVQRARSVCWALDIKHYVLNGSMTFSKEVVTPFVEGYARGITPSPCILCNEKVKFGFLLNRAVQFDCRALATGHYARIARDGGEHRLMRAADHSKDQSYFLHRLSQVKLAHVEFPLGEMMKGRDVRPHAERRELPVGSRGESQDLCFVQKNEYASFVESRCPEVGRQGPVLTMEGRKLGTHRGIHRYTIGQRRGLGIAAGEPLYVIGIDADANSITVGSRADAMRRQCRLRDIHWVLGRPPDSSESLQVQIRYLHRAAPAEISFKEKNCVDVDFGAPQFAISPGQAGVIYRDDEVLGGGWIV